MRYIHLAALALSILIVLSCSRPPGVTDQRASQLSPLQRIAGLPPADPQMFRKVRDMKEWKNPYLIIRVDGIALLDRTDNEQKILTPDQLVEALAGLPASAWPYGRVVAIAESAVSGSDQEKAQLRKNRALAAGTLEGSQVLINWVPSS